MANQPLQRGSTMAVHNATPKRKEIYKYETSWPLHSMNWSVRPDKKCRLALGSFKEKKRNKVLLVNLENNKTGGFYHPFPPTKIKWIPDSKGVHPDLLATSGEYLRVWRVGEQDTSLEWAFTKKKKTAGYSLLTSLDWNEVDQNLIGASCDDGTCTIWSLDTKQIVGRVNRVGHDRVVHDIGFSRAGPNIFATVGEDALMTVWDARALKYPTIIYRDHHQRPLVELAYNVEDSNLLATVPLSSREVIILDVRAPNFPVAQVNNRALVNGIAWAPYSSTVITTAGGDGLIRQFNMYELKRPKTIYTDPQNNPLGGLAWRKQEPNYLATLPFRGSEIRVVDASDRA